jgi:hypothetical protein
MVDEYFCETGRGMVHWARLYRSNEYTSFFTTVVASHQQG